MPVPRTLPPAADDGSAAPDLQSLLAGDAAAAAAGLIGCVLERWLPDGSVLRVQLVELEAYHQSEPGCHAHRGRTPRTAVMFGPAARLYVYFTYGMWHCANIVCGPEGEASAVLLRAAALLSAPPRPPGEPELRVSGPGLLCKSLRLDRSHSGMQLRLAQPRPAELRAFLRRPDELGRAWLYRPAGLAAPPLSWTTRVGFSFQDTLPWRCFWTGHPAVGKVSLKPLRRKGEP